MGKRSLNYFYLPFFLMQQALNLERSAFLCLKKYAPLKVKNTPENAYFAFVFGKKISE